MIEDTIDEVCHTYKKRFNYIAEDFFKELNLIVKVVTRSCMWLKERHHLLKIIFLGQRKSNDRRCKSLRCKSWKYR